MSDADIADGLSAKEIAVDFLEDIADEYFGVDVVEFRDGEKAKRFMDMVARAYIYAEQTKDTDFLAYMPSTVRAWAASHGVVIARGKERLFTERLFILIKAARSFAPLFL